MKFLVILAVVACAAADISQVLKDESTAPILRQSYDLSPEGQFEYTYETANGIAAQAQGSPKNINSEYPGYVINGGFRYTAPDGSVVEESYQADEEGFKPVSNHIPTPPPVPELILKSLQYIAAHPPSPAKL